MQSHIIKKTILSIVLVTGMSGLAVADHNSSQDEFGMEFVRISPVPFQMAKKYSVRESETEKKYVNIDHDYEILTTEVTQAMYFTVTGKNPSRYKRDFDCYQNRTNVVSPITGEVVSLCLDHPVETISFEDAKNFIDALNRRTNFKFNYRLPTEEEWEFAARGGVEAQPFGESEEVLQEHAIYNINSWNQTQKVGPYRSFANKPNDFGLYDMYGNVSEWVNDPYSDSLVARPNPADVCPGPQRIARGDSYLHKAWHLLSYYGVSCYDPATRFDTLGFRLVRKAR